MRFMLVLPSEQGVDADAQRVRDQRELVRVRVASRILPGLDGGAGDADAAPQLGLCVALRFAQLCDVFRVSTSLTIACRRGNLTLLTVNAPVGCLPLMWFYNNPTIDRLQA